MPFHIIRDDITGVHADAIVTTADPEPVYGDGTDAAIYEAAGREELLRARQTIGHIRPGEAIASPAFALDAKYIIHVACPVWEGGEKHEAEVLRACYHKSLALARDLGCESIAFPLIATGAHGYPKAEALALAAEACRSFLEAEAKEDQVAREADGAADAAVPEMDITLVVHDEGSFHLSGQIFRDVDAYINRRYAEAREYGIAHAAAAAPSAGYVPNADASPSAGAAPFERPQRRRRAGLFGLAGKAQREESASEADFSSLNSIPIEGSDAICTAAEESGAAEGMDLAASANRRLDDVVRQVSETWQESLLRLIDEKGFTDVEVYKRANVDRKLFSKIRSNKFYQPRKNTAVAFALALRLNKDETRDLLARAGYALSPSSVFDLIIEYFIEEQVYDSYTINLALFAHDQPLIGE